MGGSTGWVHLTFARSVRSKTSYLPLPAMAELLTGLVDFPRRYK